MVAGHRLLARQHDARLRRVLPDAIGDHLIHADAGVDDRALLNVRAGEQAARSAPDECPGRSSALLKRPSITLIFCFSGSSGASVLLSFISAPEPSALQ